MNSMDPIKPPTTYVFAMDRWTPKTLPAKRLAQYLEKLATLFGDTEAVHFVKIRPGSIRQYLMVDPLAAQTVYARLTAVKSGVPDPEAAGARKDINKMLMDDRGVGYVKANPGAKIIDFPGRKTPIAEEITVHEAGELDGTVIRVGGKRDKAIPVTLDNNGGEYFRCSATKEMAKQLAVYLFEGEVRVSGNGKWARSTDGVWQLQSFEIKAFTRLEGQSLSGFISDMRKIEGSGWNSVEDAQAELRKMRKD